MESKYHTVISFWVERTDSFAVEIKSWAHQDPFKSKKIWNWNVYAHIYEKHPLFNSRERLHSLTFSGGITFDKLKTIAPLFNEPNDTWNKVTETITIGSDYNHSWDNHDNHDSPFDNIPSYVLRDALTLVEELNEIKGESL